MLIFIKQHYEHSIEEKLLPVLVVEYRCD